MDRITLLLLILILIIVLYIVGVFNKLIYLKKKIEQCKSVEDVYLKKRFDLIPNLVETVKAYAKYEKGTIEEIISLRNHFNETNDKKDADKLNKHYQKLIALAESYPDLKANENFLQLQKELSKVESEIQASRRLYINSITKYNTYLGIFPSNIFGKIMGYVTEELPKYDSEDIKISF